MKAVSVYYRIARSQLRQLCTRGAGPFMFNARLWAVSFSALMVLGPGIIGNAFAALYPGAHSEKPNVPSVLLIALDDLNDWIGCLGGHPDTKTPNLDRLAERGTLFTRAYCAAPACGPSRAALLTGIRPSSSGVYRNNQLWRSAMPDAVTLPQHFKQNGYRTLGAGKIFHGRYWSGIGQKLLYHSDAASWDEYVWESLDPLPEHRPVNGIPNMGFFDWGPLVLSPA